MATLSLTGIDLHYEHIGEQVGEHIGEHIDKNDTDGAPPILLLAGMASDSASWKPVITDLASDTHIITMDNRCAGQTRPLTAETSRALMVQDVLDLLDACNIEKATLIGHSLGALICWAVAAQAPERINAVIENAAHSIHWENPKAFVSEIRSFLTSIP